MSFEKTSGDPLIDGVSHVFNQFGNPGLIFLLCSFYGFEVEFEERLQRILIHVLNYTE